MNKYRRSWQENLVLALDVLIVIFCYVASYFLRFDGLPPEEYFDLMIRMLPLVVITRLVVLFYFKLHKSIWQYASIRDLVQIIKAVSISTVFIMAVAAILHIAHPRSLFIIDWLVLIIGFSGMRFVIRLSRPLRRPHKVQGGRLKKVLVMGAGDAGEKILREMMDYYGFKYEVVGLIDDDPKKYKKHIHGVTVLGASSDIPDIVRKKDVEEIIIAIPSLKSDQMREIIDYCVKGGVEYRTVPNISDVVGGKVKIKGLREVRLEDLLKRDEVRLDREKIGSYITGRRVMITGAGGSIGAELCRQVASFSPEELILFEKSENALFYMDIELAQSFGGLKKVPIVGDMCDRKRVIEVFARYRPRIVFHAAAHKHVPLMETNSMEAIKNNVFGTRILAEEASNAGVEKFIMLSTDKAVEPTSLMGVSKRVAEMYVAVLARTNGTKFMAVRFGNVLGSEGSVIPIFKKQIERGGPITITHPDIKRYFMTIPEAAGLVLEAGFMGEGGEIFILEMERQVKILNIARDLIRLSGKEPHEDVEIVFTGLRPGEKMHEALIAVDEELIETCHEKIYVVKPQKESKIDMIKELEMLEEIVSGGTMSTLLEKLRYIVPAYTPSPQVYHEPSTSEEARGGGREIDILIADDEKMIQDILSKFLEGRGYNIHAASNSREALEIIKDNEVHLAIVDLKIPGFMGGFKVLLDIKKLQKDTEVIIITGFGSERTQELCSRLGAYAYLEKPFDLVAVGKYVEAALDTQVDIGSN